MFIPLVAAILIGTYVVSFKDEFDKENINTVLMVVAVMCVLLVLVAVLVSVGGASTRQYA